MRSRAMTLKAKLDALATKFAADIIAALRSAPLAEVSAATARSMPPMRGRRRAKARRRA